MASLTSIRARLARAFTKVDATDEPVYKRVFTRVGGDAVTGRGTTVTHVDTLLNPQPVVSRLSHTPGVTVDNGQFMLGGAGLVLAGDKYLLMHPTAMSRADLENANIAVVFKGAGSAEVEFSVVYFEPVSLYGGAVLYHVFLRSRERV